MNRSFTISGFGFSVRKVTPLAMYNFLKNHRSSIDEEATELLEFIDNPSVTKDDINNMYDTFDYMECEMTCDQGLNAMIANIMARETDINFEYHTDGDSDYETDIVILPESMPWQYTETEKQLTEETLTQICSKYTEELGLVDTNIGICTIEYYS